MTRNFTFADHALISRHTCLTSHLSHWTLDSHCHLLAKGSSIHYCVEDKQTPVRKENSPPLNILRYPSQINPRYHCGKKKHLSALARYATYPVSYPPYQNISAKLKISTVKTHKTVCTCIKSRTLWRNSE